MNATAFFFYASSRRTSACAAALSLALAACASEVHDGSAPSERPDPDTQLPGDGGGAAHPSSDGGADGGPGGPGDAAGAQCSADFCWQAPLPSGNTIGAAWASSRTDRWWVGRHGTVLHGDGSKIVSVAVPTTADLYCVGGTSASDVWVGGDDGVLLHFDGKTWRKVGTGGMKKENLAVQLRGIVSPKPGELFIMTTANFVHMTSSGFTEIDGTDARAIAMAPDGTVWINSDYAFQRWNGTAFDGVTSPKEYAYRMVFSSPTAGWAATSGGIARWDGTKWAKVTIAGASGFEPVDIAGATDDDVWAAGYGGLYHYASGSWAKVDVPELTALGPIDGYYHSYALLALAKDDVWLGSRGGVTFHWDGASWKPVAGMDYEDVRVVIAVAPDDVWAASSDSTAHFDGKSWQPVAEPTWLTSGVAVGPKTAYATDLTHTVLRYDGASWTEVAGVSGDRVWGSAPDDVWVITKNQQAAKHFDGGSWSTVTLPTKSDIIWGTSKTHVWVTGEDPKVQYSRGAYRYDGSTWTKFPVPAPLSFIAFGGTEKDVFAIDSNIHAVHRFNGTSFGMKSPLVDGVLTTFWSRSPAETWAVGTSGSVARWDGSKWEVKESPAANDLLAISGTATSGPWIVGESGAILVKR